MRGLVFFDNALDDEAVDVEEINPVTSLLGTHEDALIDGDPHNLWGPLQYNPPPVYKLVDFNLGAQQTINGWGMVNHNAYSAVMSRVTLGGNNNGSSTFTAVDVLDMLNTYDHDPCVAKIDSTPATYQWWQMVLNSSTYAQYYGGMFLAKEVEEFPETPDAPFAESQFHQMVSAETQGGSERRQVRGEPFYTRTLRWSGTTKAMADLARKMWIRQNGRERYFLYVPHTESDNQPTSPQGYYIPEPVRFERLTIRELAPGGRYSIVMTLVGLLRANY